MNEKSVVYERATTKEVILYGGAEGLGFSINLFITMFFMYFTANVYLVPVAFAGLIVTIARFFDAITDPIVGTIIDRTNTKWGRFRPFVLIGGILYPLSAVLLFWGPDIGNKAIYMLIFYILNSLGITFLSVAVNSTRGIMTKDPAQRVMLSIPATIAMTIAMMIIMIGTVPFTQHFGGEIKAWRLWVIALAVLCFVSWRCFDFAIRKKDTPDKYKIGGSEKVTFKQQWQIMKSNRPLQMLIIASATNDLATGINAAVQMFFWVYVVRRIELQPITGALAIPVMLIMSIVVGGLAKKFSKKQIFVVGSWFGLIIPVIILVIQPFDNIPLLLGLMILSTLASPLTQVTKFPMMADCIDYGEWKTDVKAAGAISSVFTFFNKLGNSIPAVIVGVILASLGFVEGAETQNQGVLTAIVWIMYGGAIFGHVCSVIAMKFYPITRELYDQMITDMQKNNDKITQ